MSISPLELPIARSTQAGPPRPAPGERDRLIRAAKALSWLSLAYMTAEGAIAVTAAMLAGSVALLGFGLDSAIEASASVIVIWRFSGTRRLSEHAERRAEQMVATSFLLLAHTSPKTPYAPLSLVSIPPPAGSGSAYRSRASSSCHCSARPNSASASASAPVPPPAKAPKNMLCAYLAADVLLSLALNAAFGLWWTDPAGALAIAALATHEGHQTWQGKGCCAATQHRDAGRPVRRGLLTTANTHNRQYAHLTSQPVHRAGACPPPRPREHARRPLREASEHEPG